MGHLYHGELLNNQMVTDGFEWKWMEVLAILRYPAIICVDDLVQVLRRITDCIRVWLETLQQTDDCSTDDWVDDWVDDYQLVIKRF